MEKQTILRGIYQHYSGKMYEVLGVARHSETHEIMVVYKKLYGDYNLWVRPCAMFIEDVVYEGRTMPRFTFIAETMAQPPALR